MPSHEYSNIKIMICIKLPWYYCLTSSSLYSEPFGKCLTLLTVCKTQPFRRNMYTCLFKLYLVVWFWYCLILALLLCLFLTWHQILWRCLWFQYPPHSTESSDLQTLANLCDWIIWTSRFKRTIRSHQPLQPAKHRRRWRSGSDLIGSTDKHAARSNLPSPLNHQKHRLIDMWTESGNAVYSCVCVAFVCPVRTTVTWAAF